MMKFLSNCCVLFPTVVFIEVCCKKTKGNISADVVELPYFYLHRSYFHSFDPIW